MLTPSEQLWRDLDPHSRALLVQEILIVNPTWRETGLIDYDSSLPPLFEDTVTRAQMTLDGRVFRTGDGALNITVNPGSVGDFPVVDPRLWLWLIAGLLLVLLATGGRAKPKPT